MALDTRLPLATNQLDMPSALINAENLKGARTQNELMQITRRNAQADQPLVDAKRENAIQMEQVASTVMGAERLRTFVEDGDLQSGLKFLQARRANLQARGRPTTGTDGAIAEVQRAMQTGDSSQLLAGLNRDRELGVRLGILNAPTSESPFGKPAIKDYTPESIKIYERTGDPADLRAAETSPLVTITGDPNNPGTKAVLAEAGNRYNERDAAANTAASQNIQLDRIALALQRGAQTGVGQTTLVSLSSLANTIFGDFYEPPPELGEQQVIESIGNAMALVMRNPDSGLGLPGATSNKDLDFLRGIVPGLSRTKEGNLQIIDYLKRLNNMKIATADYQRSVFDQNGGQIPNDLDSRVRSFVANYQFFTPEERSLIEAAQQEAPAEASDEPREINFNDLPP